MKSILKFTSLFYFLFLLTQSFTQNFNKKIEDEFNEIFEDDYFQSTMLAVSIYDLTTDEMLYEKNAEMLLHPASNMKILTTSAALEFLGPDYKFNTSVYHTGIIMDSVCYGDIIVEGGFDPDFTSEDLDTLADAIINYGIKEIRGNIYGDVSKMDSLFWGNGWMWDDDPSSDFPYMTPLIINDACIKIAFQPGIINKPVEYNIIPETDYFDIVNSSITTKEDTSDFEVSRDWIHRGNEIILKGDLSYKAEPDTEKINIVNPEHFFLYLLKEKLEKRNIFFLGRLDTLSVPEFAKKIYTHERTFGDIINNLNKESDNLSAEMTLRALAFEHFGKPASAENGIKMIDSLIARTDLEYKNYRIVDGSGVSHYNLVSTELLVEILKYMYYKSNANYEILKESFPLAGIDGTLEHRMKRTKAYDNIHAKTGTLSGVSTLSGYLETLNKHQIAFSIFEQNFVGSARIARGYQDKICAFLSNLTL